MPPEDSRGSSNLYQAPASPATADPPPIVAAGRIPWLYWAGVAILDGTRFGVFCSLLLSFWLSQTFSSILLGPGGALGLFFGLYFGTMMAVVMRPAATTLPIAPGIDLAERLDTAASKLRLRLLSQDEGVWCYGRKPRLRPKHMKIIARIGETGLTLIGPWCIIKMLAKSISG